MWARLCVGFALDRVARCDQSRNSAQHAVRCGGIGRARPNCCVPCRLSKPAQLTCPLACPYVPADPRLVPGGGAVEMAVSHGLAERANSGAVEGVEQVGTVLRQGSAAGRQCNAGQARAGNTGTHM